MICYATRWAVSLIEIEAMGWEMGFLLIWVTKLTMNVSEARAERAAMSVHGKNILYT